jgi:hypothetical protein
MSNQASNRTNALNRRRFLYYSALAAAGFGALGSGCAAPSIRKLGSADKLRVACIGVGGKGRSDLHHTTTEEIVALCDVDDNQAAEARGSQPKAKFYYDWRELLEKEEKNIDAVVISTPDHLHGAIAAAAIKMGKHVYCQKPLTQTVHEARYLRKLAKEYNVITQMGNQGSAEDGLRRAVEIVHAGVIGPVRQIHVWTNRPIWPQGVTYPTGSDPVPDSLKWDLWLGPAAARNFKAYWPTDMRVRNSNSHAAVYHPFVWRGWYDFGTGAMGDMACHTANMPFRAAKLGYPRLVELLDHSELNSDSFPKTARIRFVFPEREGLPETELFWYDGNPGDSSQKPLRPAPELTQNIKELTENVPVAGCLLIGDKGEIFSPDDYGARFFIKLKDDKEYLQGSQHEAARSIPVTQPRNQFQGDADHRHHMEWIAACKGGPTPYSNFDFAAYLTEIILLGSVALRTGKRLDWDGPNMRATNAPEASQFVKRTYRKGWELA